jgi:predicted dehydrogenase
MNLDAISLALPPLANEAAAEQALMRGIPVLCEKPLSSSAASAAHLATLAEKTVTAINYRFPELPAFKHLKEVLAAGDLGNPHFAQVTWFVNSFANRHRKWSWKTDAAQYGGALTLLGSHVLHLSQWLFGTVSDVQATMSNAATSRFALSGSTASEDSLQMTLRFSSHMIVCVTISNAMPGLHTHRWEIACEKGSLILENDTTDYVAGFGLRQCDDARGSIVLFEPGAAPAGDGRLAEFHGLAERFVRSVRTGQPCWPDFALGATIQSLMEAVRASTVSGAPVNPSSAEDI